MTFFAKNPLTLDAILLLPLALIVFLVPERSYQSLPSSRPNSQPPSPVLRPTGDSKTEEELKKLSPKIMPLPALTTYRAHMLVMTFLAILAVDFPLFPRYLAKCETFGVSLVSISVII